MVSSVMARLVHQIRRRYARRLRAPLPKSEFSRLRIAVGNATHRGDWLVNLRHDRFGSQSFGTSRNDSLIRGVRPFLTVRHCGRRLQRLDGSPDGDIDRKETREPDR